MNEDRLKAILPEFSSFVSASAGTGKTKTLIDRLVNLLLKGIKPNKILCLAFTKSAAAEILSRINQKLAHLCTCTQEELSKELKALGYTEISEEINEKARILFAEFVDSNEPLNVQTIHSFCQGLISKFPFESGVNLNFQLLDNNQAMSFLEKARFKTLNLSKSEPRLKEALDYLSWHLKEYSLDELIKEIISNREKLDLYYKNNPEINYKKIEDEEALLAEFLSSIKLDQGIIKWLKLGSKSDVKKGVLFERFFNLPDKLKVFSIQEYFSCFLTQSGTLSKNLVTKSLQENEFSYLDFMLKEQERVYKFYRKYNQVKLENLTNCFLIFSYYLRSMYQELKRENNSLDYSDLIFLADELLSNHEASDWIRYKLDGGIDHILVDEAQDNSLSQWNIINKISEEFFYSSDVLKSLFIVGDSKQSIFRFQGAEPQIFNQMNQSLPENFIKLELNTSYRSGENILKYIDSIFNQAFIKPHVSLSGDEINHIANKEFSSEVEIWPLIVQKKEQEKQEWSLAHFTNNEGDAEEENELLAKKIAQEIALWLNEKKYIHCKNRAIIPGDILILTRRRGSFIHTLIKELRMLNVPTAGVDRFDLFRHPIILDIIALSKFVLCKADDFNLAIILKSPIFKLVEQNLMELLLGREETLWKKLCSLPKYSSIFDALNNLEINSLFEFYFNLIEVVNLRKIYLEEYGLQANEILESFLDLVEKYEKNNIPNLQLFIDSLTNSSLEIQRDFSQSLNQVKIMTVHAAKGLQAPVVILTDTTKLPMNMDNIIWTKTGKPYWSAKVKYHSDEIVATKVETQAHEYAEYLRLLYVALTRAEEKIIITGVSSKEEISDKTWYGICSKF